MGLLKKPRWIFDMLEIDAKSLDVILPSKWIKMVVMQPHVYLTASEPFRWPDDKKTTQNLGINRTLDVAKNQQAHFVLFPEYSIPGLDGVQAITSFMVQNSWPKIVISGVEGLSKEQYQQLCEQSNTNCHRKNKPDQVGSNEWVNCSVTWIKDNSGNINKYVQPKVCPAWTEKNIRYAQMFRGKASYLFSAKYENNSPCRFTTFICFDWIGKINGLDTKVVDDFLHSMNTSCQGNPQQLHWIFVLQENDEPNDDLFVQATSTFLTQRSQYNLVDRSKAAIVLVNNAARNDTSDRAFTSCVFPVDVSFDTKGCLPTISYASEKLRGRQINRCKDVIFREQRPSIHSFDVRVAQFLDVDQISRCYPIENANVHPLDITMNDPRFPDGPVPGCVKWINDMLDNTDSLSERISINHLNQEVKTSHGNIIGAMRQINADKHEKNIHYATVSHQENNEWQNADEWADDEEDALGHMLDTLTMIRAAYPMDLAESLLHAKILIDNKWIEIIAIRGSTHDKCFKYLFDHIRWPMYDKTFVITRDDNNSAITEGLVKKYTGPNPSENTITKKAYIIKGFETLQKACQVADSLEKFKQEIASYVA